MALLHRGVDLSVIALWLGHESTETTQIYLHADMQLKERALAHATPSGLAPDRFRPTDPLCILGEPVVMPISRARKARDPPRTDPFSVLTRHNPVRGIMQRNVRCALSF